MKAPSSRALVKSRAWNPQAKARRPVRTVLTALSRNNFDRLSEAGLGGFDPEGFVGAVVVWRHSPTPSDLARHVISCVETDREGLVR